MPLLVRFTKCDVDNGWGVCLLEVSTVVDKTTMVIRITGQLADTSPIYIKEALTFPDWHLN